jgi:hypothetical protein
MARMDAGRCLHAFLSIAVAINAGFVSEGISQPICIVAKILSKGLKTTGVVQDTTVSPGTTGAGGDTLFLFAPELLSHTRTRP